MADAANNGYTEVTGSQDLPFNPRGVSPVTTLTQHFVYPTPFQHPSAVAIPPHTFPTYYAPLYTYPQHIVTTNGSAPIPCIKPAYLVHESVIQSTSEHSRQINDEVPAKKLKSNTQFETKQEMFFDEDDAKQYRSGTQITQNNNFSFSGQSGFHEKEFKKEKMTDDMQSEHASCLTHTRQTNVLMTSNSLPNISQVSSISAMNGSSMEMKKLHNNNLLELEPAACVICGDKATGNHYGVTSCEGCKGFFKRTVQNKKTYTCRNLSKDCPIDKRHRNRCQYCRYQKCINAGMLKDAVREDRTPGGKHKNVNLLKINIPSPDAIPIPAEAKTWSYPLIEELCKIECPDVMPTFSKVPGEDFGTMEQLIELAVWQRTHVLKWFNTLDFLKIIHENDKSVLIQSSLMELLALGVAWRSVHLQDKLLLAKDVYLDCINSGDANMGDIAQRIVQLSIKVNELKLDPAEYVCLTIIVLLNPDIKNLKDQKNVESLQDTVHTAMQGYIAHRYPDQPNRFGNVLLRLPELRSISTKITERLFWLKVTSKVNTGSPLGEILYNYK